MASRNFRVAKWFVVANYITLLFCFPIVFLFFYGASDMWNQRQYPGAFLSGIFGVSFIVGAIYTIRILPRFKETVLVTESEITHKLADGTSITISWEDGFQLRNRPLLGRLEVISVDGLRTIRLEHQLNGFEELLVFIKTKLKD